MAAQHLRCCAAIFVYSELRSIEMLEQYFRKEQVISNYYNQVP